MNKNAGFDPNEIAGLKEECKAEGRPYVYVEDEQDLANSGEYVQIQFIGKYQDQEVIYDAAIYTLELHHNSLLIEEAEKRVAAIYKDFVPLELREPSYKANEEADEMVQEFIEEMEEDESIKVAEHLEIDTDFDYGIGLDVALNHAEITSGIIKNFISDFNAGSLELDETLYSFKQDDSED